MKLRECWFCQKDITKVNDDGDITTTLRLACILQNILPIYRYVRITNVGNEIVTNFIHHGIYEYDNFHIFTWKDNRQQSSKKGSHLMWKLFFSFCKVFKNESVGGRELTRRRRIIHPVSQDFLLPAYYYILLELWWEKNLVTSFSMGLLSYFFPGFLFNIEALPFIL